MSPRIDGRMHVADATKSPATLVQLARCYAAHLSPRPPALRERTPGKAVVLITGTTGNFGCDLLESALRDEGVAFVYALNRKGTDAGERQRAAFLARGFDAGLLVPSRYCLVEGEFDAPAFGLEPSLLDEIRTSVTCIIHNAWQVNFNAPLRSFNTFFKSLRQLVEISLSCPYTTPPKIQFISSTGIFQSGLARPIPEESIPPSSALGYGYPESKWVAEQMLLEVAHTTDVPVQIVRLGQTCGDRNGHWNETEWLPIVVKSALSVGCLPDMDGDAAFLPNYVAARAVLEMSSSSHDIVHLVHPRPVRLRTLLGAAAAELGVPLLPYNVWLDRLAASAASIAYGKGAVQMVRKNPALALLGFFSSRQMVEDDEPVQFIPVSTRNAEDASPTLATLPALTDAVATQWISAWRASGFLDA